MSLASGTHLGQYKILASLGAGGMGEVYRARDTRLGRDVALKTLPASVSADGERLARFGREAQVLAALNHPHIASIYGVEETDGQRFLVLELVEGETLAARIQRGALPIDEAIAIARETAEALDAAHAKGIIHRDLKPANIALTTHDRVKVLDFGLAKATEAAAAEGLGPLNSPTITSPAMLTGLGVILGTAAYMSPEQARGRAADKRSDVWAFGCVLFEMLTARRPFGGEEVSDTLAAVLKTDPDWNALPASLPPSIRSLLKGCLEKDYRERISDISTALFILKRQPTPDAPAPLRPASRRWMWVALLVGAAAAGAVAAIAIRPTPTPASLPVSRFGIAVPEGMALSLARRVVAVSPDGTRILFAADGRIYLRSLADADEPKPVPGIDSGGQPVFSPDGESFVFWSDPSLKRVSISGGVPTTVCQTTPAPYGIDWSRHGIVFVQPGAGIMRVSATGSTPELLVGVNARDGLAHGPQLLPDGDTLLFTLARPETTSANAWDNAQVVAHSLKTGRRKTLVDGASDGRYLPTGHLVYMVEGTLMAASFDASGLQITSEAVPVVEGIRRSGQAVGRATQYAVSSTGVLVYVPGPARELNDDVVFLYDRTGAVTPLNLPRGSYSHPRASPDGKWLALETSDGKQAAVSVFELSGANSVRRLTFGGNNRMPIWSADGTHVVFQSDRDGDRAIFWQPVNGGTAERLTRPGPGTSHVPESWSPKGDVVLYSVTKELATSLWTFSIRDRQSARFGDVASLGVPTNAVFSPPDGRWVAYQSGDTATGEAIIYVEPVPPTGTKFEIGRGGRPLWSRDGREMFFVPGPSQFAAVSVRTEPSFGFTPPHPVIRRFGLAPPQNPRPYDILPDGRFVAVDVSVTAGDQRSPAIQVVLNWFEDVKRRVPAPK